MYDIVIVIVHNSNIEDVNNHWHDGFSRLQSILIMTSSRNNTSFEVLLPSFMYQRVAAGLI
jgi:hypothetical protein